MISCLFFLAAGNATQLNSSYDCNQQDLFTEFFRSLAVGLFSTLVSWFVLLILILLQARRFVYDECWTDQKRFSYLKWWRVCDVLLWVFAVGYSLFSALFIASFLANVDSPTASRWAGSSFTAILWNLLGAPALTAAVLAILATVLIQKYPLLLEKVKENLEVEELFFYTNNMPMTLTNKTCTNRSPTSNLGSKPTTPQAQSITMPPTPSTVSTVTTQPLAKTVASGSNSNNIAALRAVLEDGMAHPPELDPSHSSQVVPPITDRNGSTALATNGCREGTGLDAAGMPEKGGLSLPNQVPSQGLGDGLFSEPP